MGRVYSIDSIAIVVLISLFQLNDVDATVQYGVRLNNNGVHGQRVPAGRVEVTNDNGATWGIICDDAFEQVDGNAICRMLGSTQPAIEIFVGGGGYGTSTAIAAFGSTAGMTLVLDDMACHAGSTTIESCYGAGVPWGRHNCIVGEAVGVRCWPDGPVCEAPEAPANGAVTVSGTQVGATATYSCEHPLTPQMGHTVRFCQDDGTWTGVAPQCLEPKCKCTGSGDVHYHLFDGPWTHFQGVCTYILAQTTGVLPVGLPEFTVLVNSEKIQPWHTVSFVDETYVSIYGYDIVLNRNNQVRVDGIWVWLPFLTVDGRLNIRAEGAYQVLEAANGLLLRHYRGWPSHFELWISGAYRGHIEGLCGNCNGDNTDDKYLRYTGESGNDAQIGDSWIANHDRQSTEGCEVITPHVPGCEDDTIDVSMCQRIRTDPSLQPCVAQMSDEELREFIFTCEYDICQGTPEGVLCNSVQVFVSRCREILNQQLDWRANFDCPYGCPANSVYTIDFGLCPATCLDPNPTAFCYFEPMEGCVCAEGFVVSGTECIPANECGCQVEEDGKLNYYPQGAMWYSGDCLKLECSDRTIVETVDESRCHEHGHCLLIETIPQSSECVCDEGFVGNGISRCRRIKCPPLEAPEDGEVTFTDRRFFQSQAQFSCPAGYDLIGSAVRVCQADRTWSGEQPECRGRPCQCIGVGDVHYRLFDGPWTHYQGVCTYIAAETPDLDEDSSPPGFSLYVNQKKLHDSHRVSFVKEVYLTVCGHEVILTPSTLIQVDGNQYGMPFTFAGTHCQFSVYASGAWTTVESSGLLVLHYLRHWPSRFVLTVSGDYRNKMEGICGNCNADPTDDKFIRGTEIHGNDAEIGDSWIVAHARQPTEGCEVPTIEVSGCDDDTIDVSACQQIRDDPSLEACRAAVGDEAVGDVVFNCEYDICAGTPLDEVLCGAVEALVSTCRDEHNIRPDWRANFDCPYGCPANSVYTTSKTLCEATCLEPEPTGECFSGEEGCVCADNFVMSGTECTPLSECGCVVEDEEGFTSNYPAGAVWFSGDCLTRYECIDAEVVEAQRPPCHSDGHCEFDEGVATCVCDLGYEGDGYDCNPISCGDPGTPANGNQQNPNHFLFGSEVTFTCNDGYLLRNGHAVRECQADGTWSGVQPECVNVGPDCTCTGVGDVHYRYFDGGWTHYQGQCTYILAQSTDLPEGDNLPEFMVYVNSKRAHPSASVSYVNETYVHIYGHDIVLNRDSLIQVDGEQYGLPFSTSGGQITVCVQGAYTVLRTEFVDIYHYRSFPSLVVVVVSGAYRGYMEGLCGNCNANPGDDKIIRYTDESGTDAEVGDSWIVNHPRQSTVGCEVPTVDVPGCDDPNIDVSACQQILTDPSLQACRDGLDDEVIREFVFTCEYDLCLGDPEGVLCNTVANLVTLCRDELNIQPDWRESFGCPYGCPANSDYHVDVGVCPLSLCEATCLNPEPTDHCYFNPIEGCKCRRGFVQSGTECVPRSQCGCVVEDDNGFISNYPRGHVWYSGDCLTKFECREGVVVETSRPACDADAQCVFVDEVATCRCNEDFDGDGYDCRPSVEGCDHTWTHTLGNYCYKLVLPKAKHHQAVERCADMGAVLTPVTSAAETDVIKDMLNAIGRQKTAWIGARITDYNRDSVVWTDPDVVTTYSNWAARFPKDLRGGGDDKCMFVKSGNRKWKNRKCNNRQSYICRKEASP